jgi:hypothetical protein
VDATSWRFRSVNILRAFGRTVAQRQQAAATSYFQQQPSGATMSIARGNHAKGQPAHMNTFAFRHNVGSKKTARIARLPVHTMCTSCTRVILWKKK